MCSVIKGVFMYPISMYPMMNSFYGQGNVPAAIHSRYAHGIKDSGQGPYAYRHTISFTPRQPEATVYKKGWFVSLIDKLCG